MHKKFIAKGTLFTLLCTNLIAPLSLYAKEVKVTESVNNPSIGQLVDVILPERASSSSTIINSKQSFKAYKGQGTLYLTPQNVTSAKIYVNGIRLKDVEDKLVKNSGKTLEIDIANYVVTGQNTIQISDIQPQSATIEIDVPYPTLREGTPEDVGMDAMVFDVIDDIIEAEVRAGGIPGGQLLVAKDGIVIKNESYGYTKIYDHNGPVRDKKEVNKETLYDLASNTKMYAVNYAIQQLVYEGKLDLDASIDSIIPGFSEYDEAKQELNVKHLLTHTAGFAPDPMYHRESYLRPLTIDGEKVNLLDKNNDGKNDVYTHDPSQMLEMVKKTPLEYKPSTKNVYSDVDYILLGFIVEAISGETLDVYCQENIFKPLGLSHTVYNPKDHGFDVENIAATEVFGNTREHFLSFDNIRTEVVQGEVHDEKAFYSMGGVSGHAGLFSTASDLAILMQTVLNGGGYGDVQLFNQKTIDTFMAPSKTDDTYGLGWRRQGDKNYAWSFGQQATDRTIGHTGWTGTSTSINPDENLLIVWLSNTKNTPAADPAKNVDRMEGDAFQFDAAGTVSTLIYDGIIGTSREAIGEALLQMSLDRTAVLLEEIELDRNCTPADYRAATALVEVLFEQAKDLKGDEKEEALRRAMIAYDALPEHEAKAALKY